MAYGLTGRTEIVANVGYIFWDIHEGGREDGWSDVYVYFKYRVWDEGKFHPALPEPKSLFQFAVGILTSALRAKAG